LVSVVICSSSDVTIHIILKQLLFIFNVHHALRFDVQCTTVTLYYDLLHFLHMKVCWFFDTCFQVILTVALRWCTFSKTVIWE